MKQRFVAWSPREASLELVTTAELICEEYQQKGYDLTLRQLYYQFVARGLIENTQRSYKNLGTVIDKGRLAGLLDWDHIVDRTRSVYRTDGIDETPEEAIAGVARDYAKALWEDQPFHVEVWVEKEALAGVVQRAAAEMGINYFSCRGYVSQSEMYSAGRRFARHWRDGKQGVVIHLGDHDPSGIDMTRDIERRLDQFGGSGAPEVRRVALTMDQVEEYGPPPNPAKVTDSRFEAYQTEYGDESWELDALDPEVMEDLITDETKLFRDEVLWQDALDSQEEERATLIGISENYDEIVEAGLADM